MRSLDMCVIDGSTTTSYVPADASPDSHQREKHGSPAVWHHLVHVALPLATLSASEADVERLISIRRHSLGVIWTSCQSATIPARLIMHKKR
jgi:hypothetical protein